MSETVADEELLRYARRVAESGHDEVVGRDGMRLEQDLVASAIGELGLHGLLAARDEAARLVRSEGINFGPGDGSNWIVDPLPIVIGHDDWQQLEVGLQQRARLQSLLMADIYGEQKLISTGVIPAEIIWGHGAFLHQVGGAKVSLTKWLPLTAADVGRDADGTWLVLDDRTGTPAGMGYAMTNRRITSRVMGDFATDARIARLRNYFAAMRAGLHELAPDKDRVTKGVLLWGGPDDVTAYEQGFLATLLGYSLVEAEDLTLHDAKVWVDAPEGRTRVDVILRRVLADLADPLEFRGDSDQGIAGLVEAVRLSNAVVANSLGSGVLENPALLPLLPELSRQLLGEDLILPSAQTWWCGDATQLDHVLGNLDSLVLKPLHRRSDGGTVLGWELDSTQREELADRITAEPWKWSGQDPVDVSTAPVVTDGGLEPRRLVLRCFGVQATNHWEIMHGGLARMAPDGETFRVSARDGYVSKDVWVLDPEEALYESWSGAESWQHTHVTSVPPRIADNLYWLGRYGERAEGLIRLLRYGVDAASDHGQSPSSLAARALAVILEAGEKLTHLDLSSRDVTEAVGHLHRAIVDRRAKGSVAHAIDRLQSAAHRVPDIMSADIWHVLDSMQRTMDRAATSTDVRRALGDFQESTLAIAGINAESLTRDATWAFIDAGLRVERAQRTLTLIRHSLGVDRAVVLEALVTDALLSISESIFTSRRRGASGEGPRKPVASVIAVVLLDPTNPRSVTFQLRRLSEDLEAVGDHVLAARSDEIAASLEAIDVPGLLDKPRSHLAELATGQLDALRDLSDDLSQRHFTRPVRRRATLTGWGDQG